MQANVRRIVGIIGGGGGILSLFLPWIRMECYFLGVNIASMDLGFKDFMDLASAYGGSILLYLTIIMIVIGSIVAFLHPGGGAIQVGGWVSFLVFWYVLTDKLHSKMILGPAAGWSFHYGFFLMIIASIITLSGFSFKVSSFSFRQ